FHTHPKDKPRLSLHMKRLVDTANKRNITVETKLYELPRQMKDKGITPSITSLRKEENEVKITGTALLQKSGNYATSLALEESTL
ncbi:MAG: gerSC, partial [Paenibacillaceae bacterium]|nr:gerSC [Paenibacillaceae bacterium]